MSMDSEMVNHDKSEDEAAVFATLADPTRLKLVKLLAHQDTPGALCVNALAEVLGVSQSAVSQHLRILKNIGLVSGERHGYRIHYAINPQTMKQCHDLILAALSINESDIHKNHCSEP